MAGTVLALMGAIEILVAAVFLVLAALFANPASLPSWVDIGVVPEGASLRMLGLGLLVLSASALQVIVGLAMRSPNAPAWARWSGTGLGAAGVVISIVAATAGGGFNPVFLAITAAYAAVLGSGIMRAT
jgi:hypothetical protein